MKAGCGKTARPVCAADGGQRESNRARLLRPDSYEAGEQSEESPLRRRLRGRSQRCRWSEGRGPRGIRTSKARTGLRARLACHRRWSVYGNLCRHTPEAGAVCGKAARTDLGGGRAMKRTSLPLQRREFITLLGGAAAAWPLLARAQQPERMRRIGVLMAIAENEEGRSRIAAFRDGLRALGRIEGRNLQIEARWAAGDAAKVQAFADELVKLKPDVILALSTNSPSTAIRSNSSLGCLIRYCGNPSPGNRKVTV